MTHTKLPPPYFDDGISVIYHGDARDIFPLLDAEIVVTDPPYGIEAADRFQPGAAEWAPIVGDSDTDAAAALFDMLDPEGFAIVFGANNFPELLPHRGRWICWDKRLTARADKMLGSAFELAWTSKTSGFDSMLRCLHGGIVNANGWGLARVHPTEKPVPMLRELIGDHCPKDGVIVDPFMGSGTTLRAAADLGRRSIGIEVVESYCARAVERLAQQVMDFS